MQGTIKATSGGPGSGSEFGFVRLPLLADVSTERQMETQPATENVVAGPRKTPILVADDNVDLATSMGRCLK
jgi:hypothetical protein